MRVRLPILLAVALLTGCGGHSPAKDDPIERELAERFEFPRLGATLREGTRRIRGEVVVADVVYPSSGPDNVTGFIARRAVPEEHPAGVVFMHGGGRSAADFLPDARALAERGAVALTIDSPFVRSPDKAIRDGTAELERLTRR